MGLETGLILFCVIAFLGSVALVSFALWIYAREFGGLGGLKQNMRRRLKSSIQEYTKAIVTSLVSVLLFFALLPVSLILAWATSTVACILILAFWTGAIEIKIQRG